MAYIGHRFFTFRSSQRVVVEAPKFFIKAAFGLLLASIAPEIIVASGGGIREVLWLTPLFVAATGFLISKFWVFDVRNLNHR